MSKQIKSEQELAETLRSADRVLILFYSSWCPYCQRFLPQFEKHCPDNAVNFMRIDTEDAGSVEDTYTIDVVPTLIYFEHGAAVRRLDGVAGKGLSEQQLLEMIKVCNLAKK